MGGENRDENYVLLTIKEHIIAHCLLMKIYPSNLELIRSCSAMLMKNKKDYVSTRTILMIREDYYEQKDKFAKKQVGKILSTETKDKMKINHSYNISDDTKKKLTTKRHRVIVKAPNGKIYESIKDLLVDYNIPRSTLLYWIKNKPEKGFIKIEDVGSTRKQVIGPDGIEYKSISECANKNNRDFKTIKKWIEKYPELGYKYK